MTVTAMNPADALVILFAAAAVLLPAAAVARTAALSARPAPVRVARRRLGPVVRRL